MLVLVQPEMRPIAVSFQEENKRSCSPQRISNGLAPIPPKTPVHSPRAPSKRTPIVVEQPTTASTPSTRLSGLMKRIQAKANNCQTQLESFVSNVSSAVHGVSNKKTVAVKNSPQGVVIGPVPSSPLSIHYQHNNVGVRSNSLPRPYPAYPGQKTREPDRPVQFGDDQDNKEKDKNPATKHTYVIKLATLTPATVNSTRNQTTNQQQRGPPDGPFKTWNAPASNKTRPGLSLVGFRPDKHVTCIEVTLINNKMSAPTTPVSEQLPGIQEQEQVQPGSKSPGANSAGMKTYCFGELPVDGDKSPSGTLSSRSSSRGSEQFDSGFEDITNRKLTPPLQTPPSSTSIIRSIFDKIGGQEKQRTPKVQAKRSTIRREKAFRQRNKHAWSRAKEIQRNDELLQRFHQIRKRLGEEDEQDDTGGILSSSQRLSPESAMMPTVGGLPPDLLCPLPSIVQTLVRQYDTGGGQPRSRDKIVPSRLHSKRSSGHPSKQQQTISSNIISSIDDNVLVSNTQVVVNICPSPQSRLFMAVNNVIT